MNVELLHDPRAVGLGGLDADPQEVRDLLRGLPLGDELEDLELPGAQRVGRKIALGQIRLDDGARDAGTQVDRAPRNLADRMDQVGGRLRLQDAPTKSRLQGLEDVLVLAVHRQEDQLRPGGRATDVARGRDTVQKRHVEVEGRHLRLELLYQTDRLVAVGGLAEDAEAFALQDGPEALADHDVVVGENNRHTHVSRDLPPSALRAKKIPRTGAAAEAPAGWFLHLPLSPRLGGLGVPLLARASPAPPLPGGDPGGGQSPPPVDQNGKDCQ